MAYPHKSPLIPAKAGTQAESAVFALKGRLGTRLRGNERLVRADI